MLKNGVVVAIVSRISKHDIITCRLVFAFSDLPS